ncbi:MAG TPA: class I SAM-dependent methyltransferase [Vicinamibacterales bacterium]|nr:class I SAM-dependent methyltransferase [Vicinamibacterales bacterium]
MMFLLRMLTRNRGRKLDPLHVSMTGVRMGEHVLQIGCSDRALLSGVAAKVGLSGTAAVATYDEDDDDRATAVGAKIGALIQTQPIAGKVLPFESDLFDMVVVDDTRGRFAALAEDTRLELLREAKRVVRKGGRIEIVEGVTTRAAGYDVLRDLTTAGFKPARLLAEREGFRFLEGLRPAAGS